MNQLEVVDYIKKREGSEWTKTTQQQRPIKLKQPKTWLKLDKVVNVNIFFYGMCLDSVYLFD